MASGVFINQLNAMMDAYLASGADVRLRLCMSNCDAATVHLTNASHLDDVVCDTCDATGYADLEVTAETCTLDDTNNRAVFSDAGATYATFNTSGADASRDYTGVIVYFYVDGTDANDIPWSWVEFQTPVTRDVTSVTVTWGADGITHLANG